MYIKAISLDGFKSYAQRTEIAGFDPMFNAVTGLNGSGKSNILDGICFVLGITNLSQVCFRFSLPCALYIRVYA
jgi:structural maintenance of chromosome 2